MDKKYLNKIVAKLQQYDLTYDDFLKFSYSGGNKNRHYNYWKIKMKNDELPTYEDKCVCGVSIVENCYITRDVGDSIELLVLGNCCIKRFLPKEKSCRTCENCGTPHRNRKLNKCNDCKRGICLKCFNNFESLNENRYYCYDCKPHFF